MLKITARMNLHTEPYITLILFLVLDTKATKASLLSVGNVTIR